MKPFATADDLQMRWKILSSEDIAKADILLGDASAMLKAEHDRVGKPIVEGDEIQAINLRVVACAMVKRVMANAADGDYKQRSMTAGPYSEQITFANPTGDMYITANERRILGIPRSKQRITCIQGRTKFDEV